MILSKVTFPSNVFPLPKIIQQNIEIQVFKHIWQFSNKESIATTTFFLPKNQQGIGLIHPKYHSFTMPIKHFLKLKEGNNQEIWIILTRYNLASILYNIHNNV